MRVLGSSRGKGRMRFLDGTYTKRQLQELSPSVEPWLHASLWYPLVDTPVPRVPIDDEVESIIRNKLAPLLLKYVAAKEYDLPVGAREKFEASRFQLLSNSLALTYEGVRVVDLLRRNSINCAVMKGPSVAGSYRMTNVRTFGDIDIIVNPRDFMLSVELLEMYGLERRTKDLQPRAYFDRWCREAINLTATVGSVDLHHRPSPWLWSRSLSANDLIGRARETQSGPGNLPFVSNEDNLLITALQLFSDHLAPGRRLLVWRDLVEIINALGDARTDHILSKSELGPIVRALMSGLPHGLINASLCASDRGRVPHAFRLSLLLSSGPKHRLARAHSLRLPMPNLLIYLIGLALPSRVYFDSSPESPRGSLPRKYLLWWLRPATDLNYRCQKIRKAISK